MDPPPKPSLTPRVLVVLVAANLLCYVDRGIVPGSFAGLQRSFFPTPANGTAPSDVDTQLGLLTSAFIAGYSVSSVAAGYFVVGRGAPPFHAVSISLGLLSLSALCAAAAPSFGLLIAARVLSGVAEAALQIVVPPFLDDAAANPGAALAAFFACIPVGTALGYVYAGALATASLAGVGGWRLAFALEVLPIALVVPFVWCLPPPVSPLGGGVGGGLLPRLLALFTNPRYMAVCAGYGGFTAVVAGLAAFGPALLQGFSLVACASTASVLFGAIVVVAGLLGTAAGGWAFDFVLARQLRLSRGGGSKEDDVVGLLLPEGGDAPVSAPSRLRIALWHAATATLLGTVALAAAVAAAQTTALVFLGVLGLAMTLLLSSTVTINVGLMGAVPHELRPLAVGVGVLLTHALGDVPSPAVVGALLDAWSPLQCAAGAVTGDCISCPRSPRGLQGVLLATTAWLMWPVLLWVWAGWARGGKA